MHWAVLRVVSRRSPTGVLAATFYYPLCVDKAVEVGEQILHDHNFHPEKQYILQPQLITSENASQMYQKLTF